MLDTASFQIYVQTAVAVLARARLGAWTIRRSVFCEVTLTQIKFKSKQNDFKKFPNLSLAQLFLKN